MVNRYKLKNRPVVFTNKPYDGKYVDLFQSCKISNYDNIIRIFDDKNIILYQGIVRADRPIDNVARALLRLGDDNNLFVIMGKVNKEYMNNIKEIYSNILFIDYVPAPEHLEITKHAKIGMAIYDNSNLNNEFCAPNKIYEYAKFGIPMLTSQNIGHLETVGEVGAAKCIDLNDVNSIVSAIKFIQREYDRMSKNADIFYFSENSLDKIKKIYDSIESRFI